MKKTYKVVLNLEVDEPELSFPAGGDYTHLTRAAGFIRLFIDRLSSWWPNLPVKCTLDKVIEK